MSAEESGSKFDVDVGLSARATLEAQSLDRNPGSGHRPTRGRYHRFVPTFFGTAGIEG